jgi:hypothetical protein
MASDSTDRQKTNRTSLPYGDCLSDRHPNISHERLNGRQDRWIDLRRYTQDEITAAFYISKTRGSRSIRHFHKTGLTPDALCIGRPGNVPSEHASYIETHLGRRFVPDPAIPH